MSCGGESARKLKKIARLFFQIIFFGFPNFAFNFHRLICQLKLMCKIFLCEFSASLVLSSLDPYEQKLFHLFASHENGSGCIDESGLNDLIQTLQLKERGSVLINLLLKNGSRPRVTFKEFREGLLQVITSEEDNGMELLMTFICCE